MWHADPFRGATPCRGAPLPHRKSAPALFAIDPEFGFPVYAADAAIWMAIMVQANTNLAGGGALVANEVAIAIALSLHDAECCADICVSLHARAATRAASYPPLSESENSLLTVGLRSPGRKSLPHHPVADALSSRVMA